MLEFLLVVFIVTFIVSILKIKLPDRLLKILIIGICILCFVWLFQLKFMLIIATIAMIFLGTLFDEVRSFQDFKSTLTVVIPAVLIVLFLNRGIITRVYDPANVLSPIEEYNLNHELKYYGEIDGISKTDVRIYLVTQNLDGDMEKEENTKKKIRKKENYVMICLNYDEDGNYLATGYKYDLFWFYNIGNIEFMTSRVTELMKTDGLSGNIEYIKQCVAATLGETEYFEGEDYEDDPGVHWVDEYYRDDGTHVDGYWRTDPDGDVTNNFSYY